MKKIKNLKLLLGIQIFAVIIVEVPEDEVEAGDAEEEPKMIIPLTINRINLSEEEDEQEMVVVDLNNQKEVKFQTNAPFVKATTPLQNAKLGATTKVTSLHYWD